MLSHTIKKLLDDATGLRFSPTIGMSESYPIASYELTDVERGVINVSSLEVRLQGESFDKLETLRKQITDKLQVYNNQCNIRADDYSLRIKLTGGGIIAPEDVKYYDSTQYFTITWHKITRGDA